MCWRLLRIGVLCSMVWLYMLWIVVSLSFHFYTYKFSIPFLLMVKSRKVIVLLFSRVSLSIWFSPMVLIASSIASSFILPELNIIMISNTCIFYNNIFLCYLDLLIYDLLLFLLVKFGWFSRKYGSMKIPFFKEVMILLDLDLFHYSVES